VRHLNLATLLVCLRIAAGLATVVAAIAIWKWFPDRPGSLEELAAWLAPHRHAWYALPAVILVFVAFGVALVPVMLLIAATGIVFGPILGPLYAMAGSLASASTGFAIGRWVGLRRVQRIGGERIARLTRALKRNGTLAVYFVRKVPAPFTLVNIVIGASTVRYRDFLIGTTLGMIAVVIALAGFGHQFTELLRDPSPRTVLGAVLIVAVPMTLAWTSNRALRRVRRSA
jgi:phospholipase D1/2